jgi:hypothetical protein
VANPTEVLVRCTGFEGELADLCRRRGTNLSRELRGVGSLARGFGDKWLNTEELGSLYVSCEDLLTEAQARKVERLPLDRYMHCRWVQGITESSKTLIDERIAEFYRKRQGGNDTRYRGDADVEISSLILFE